MLHLKVLYIIFLGQDFIPIKKPLSGGYPS